MELKAIKTQGGRRGLRGLGSPYAQGGPWDLTWGWERVNVKRGMGGTIIPGAGLSNRTDGGGYWSGRAR